MTRPSIALLISGLGGFWITSLIMVVFRIGHDPEWDWKLLKSFPKDAGYWVIGGSLNISVRNRPSAWNRFWTKRLLGWEWKDSL